MDISYLREFRVLAEICNYQEAAEQLYISLSTLSKHISRLESELGTPLFDRTTRKVSLNKYGAVFYDYAVLVTESYQTCALKLEELQQNDAASLRIAFPPCLTEYSFPSLLTDFINTNPDIKVILTETENPKKLLEENLCDLAFCTGYAESTGEMSRLCAMHIQPGKTKAAEYDNIIENRNTFSLQIDSLAVVLPADHPLAGEEFLTIKQLKKERFITKSDPSSELSIIFHKLCGIAGFEPQSACAVHYTSAMPKMVNAYNSIAITNRRHALICDTPNLSVIDIHPTIPYYLSVLCSDDLERAAARLRFMEYFSTAQHKLTA